MRPTRRRYSLADLLTILSQLAVPFIVSVRVETQSHHTVPDPIAPETPAAETSNAPEPAPQAAAMLPEAKPEATPPTPTLEAQKSAPAILYVRRRDRYKPAADPRPGEELFVRVPHGKRWRYVPKPIAA